MPLSFAPGWADEHPGDFEHFLAARLAHPTPPYAWRRQFEPARSSSRPASRQRRSRSGRSSSTAPPTACCRTRTLSCSLERMPDAELVRLDGAGHLALLERPDEINRAILGFLTR